MIAPTAAREYGSICEPPAEQCGVNRVARLMKTSNLQGRRKRRRLPGDSAARLKNHIAPNHLQLQIEAEAPNRKWVADFTYIRTAEGWLYVAAVMDLYSRRIVGWFMSVTMQARKKMVSDADGAMASGQAHGVAAALKPGQSVHQRRLPATAGVARHPMQREPSRRVLGQRRDRKLLLDAQDRALRANCLTHERASQSRCVRLIERFYTRSENTQN